MGWTIAYLQTVETINFEKKLFIVPTKSIYFLVSFHLLFFLNIESLSI